MWIKKVVQHGNSHVVCIPRPVLHDLEINRGDFVLILVAGDKNIVIRKINQEEAILLSGKNNV